MLHRSPCCGAPFTSTLERGPQMRRLVIVVVLGFLGWQGYQQYQARNAGADAPHEPPAPRVLTGPSTAISPYQCDGRTYCSQMTSCEEATYFLRNCPGAMMDGDNDGVPCEQQWCGR